jgi:hypothetical protein
MTKEQLDILAPLIACLVGAGLISLPLMAFCIRFAAKPLVDAFVRLREAQGGSKATNETLQLHDRRMALLESELQLIGANLEKLVEAQRFQAELAAPRTEERALRPSEPWSQG